MTVNIKAIINAEGPKTIKDVSLKLNELTNDKDIIVRLDHLYSSTVFYSDRRVLSSPDGAGNSNLFISRDLLQKKINLGEIKWIVGNSGDATSFMETDVINKYEVIKVGDETILHLQPKSAIDMP